MSDHPIVKIEVSWDGVDAVYVAVAHGLIPGTAFGYGETPVEAVRNLVGTCDEPKRPKAARPVKTKRTRGAP